MARIRWIDEDGATGELAAIYDHARQVFPGGMVPDILKTMSLRPDFLAGIAKASQLHFTDGRPEPGPARDDRVLCLGSEPLPLLGLRQAGWTDEQIAEAVYDGALFNLFVRLADAFDIHPPAVLDADGVPRAVTG